MFRCEKCNKVTEPREKLHRIPITYKDVVYQFTQKKGKNEKLITSYGKNISKEINLCEECFNEILRGQDENFQK